MSTFKLFIYITTLTLKALHRFVLPDQMENVNPLDKHPPKKLTQSLV